MNIQSAYVTFEQAKLLKEKGFNEYCQIAYDNLGNVLRFQGGQESMCNSQNYHRINKIATAPEQWQVIEWLRIEKSIWIYVIRSGNQFYPIYQDKSGDKHEIMEFYYTPQEAYSAAFDYILTNLI